MSKVMITHNINKCYFEELQQGQTFVDIIPNFGTLCADDFVSFFIKTDSDHAVRIPEGDSYRYPPESQVCLIDVSYSCKIPVSTIASYEIKGRI